VALDDTLETETEDDGGCRNDEAVLLADEEGDVNRGDVALSLFGENVGSTADGWVWRDDEAE